MRVWGVGVRVGEVRVHLNLHVALQEGERGVVEGGMFGIAAASCEVVHHLPLLLHLRGGQRWPLHVLHRPQLIKLLQTPICHNLGQGDDL